MNILVLKLVLTPTLIGIASLAGRRWGPAVSGWLVGLPFTSGPIAFFLALSHGPAFAAVAATGTLAGTISQAAFCVAYGWLALRGWAVALVAGCAAFAAATLALQPLTLPVVLVLLLVLAALTLALRLLPARSPTAAASVPPPWWDLPARMVIATAFVVLLTASAPTLGPHLTGLLAPFPLYASILAVFAHSAQGAGAAINVLRGLLLGLFAFAGFFLTLAVLLTQSGIGAAFVAAITIGLLIQGASLWVLRATQQRPRTQSEMSGR